MTPFNLNPSLPGTRLWWSFNQTNYNVYVFTITQSMNTDGTWSNYTVTWSTGAIWWQTQVYGSRPNQPAAVPGSPFVEYADALAACQALLNTLP